MRWDDGQAIVSEQAKLSFEICDEYVAEDTLMISTVSKIYSHVRGLDVGYRVDRMPSQVKTATEGKYSTSCV